VGLVMSYKYELGIHGRMDDVVWSDCRLRFTDRDTPLRLYRDLVTATFMTWNARALFASLINQQMSEDIYIDYEG
jgi:hypothetical protein